MDRVDSVADWMYAEVAEKYLFDEGMQAFLAESNPWAGKAMAERLLEAADRGMWGDVSEEMRERLMERVLEAEGDLEGR